MEIKSYDKFNKIRCLNPYYNGRYSWRVVITSDVKTAMS